MEAHIICLGIASLTGSKMVTQILNRTGHCISYSEIKGLETEFAYSAASNESDASDGIRLDPNVATACVWDNNDANVETLDGKETLHATVGHTYHNVVQKDLNSNNNPIAYRVGRNRRSFVGNERYIPPFQNQSTQPSSSFLLHQKLLVLLPQHQRHHRNRPRKNGVNAKYDLRYSIFIDFGS